MKSLRRAAKSKLPSHNFPPKLPGAFCNRRPAPAARQERPDEYDLAEKANWRLFVIIGLLFVFFCVALSAHAAEEGGGSATERANEIFKWINFAIVAAVLIWLFAKKLPVWFRGNADKISSAITKATAAKEEAERQVREAEAKLSNLKQEIAALQATAKREAAEEGERIRAQAQS